MLQLIIFTRIIQCCQYILHILCYPLYNIYSSGMDSFHIWDKWSQAWEGVSCVTTFKESLNLVLGLGIESWHRLISDISNWLMDSESEIRTYFWESMQPYYRKWSPHFGDSNHYWKAGSNWYAMINAPSAEVAMFCVVSMHEPMMVKSYFVSLILIYAYFCIRYYKHK